MKLEIETPTHLIDVYRLPLAEIEETPDGGLRIGAMVSNSDLAADPRVRERYPVLTRALLAGASGAAAQQGDHRRQPAAADALRLLLRHLQALQQARARHPAARRWRASTASMRSSAPATPASPSHPSDMAVALRALDAEVETVARRTARRAHPDRRLPSPARRDAADRDPPRAGRADHRA